MHAIQRTKMCVKAINIIAINAASPVYIDIVSPERIASVSKKCKYANSRTLWGLDQGQQDSAGGFKRTHRVSKRVPSAIGMRYGFLLGFNLMCRRNGIAGVVLY